MAPKPETIRKRMTKRVETALRTHRVAEAHFDPESGAGVIVAQNKDGKLVALFFDPATTRRFDEVEISAHERINLGAVLKARVAEEEARLMAPHDFKVGEIFHYSWHPAMRTNSFWRIIDIPKPTEIECVNIPAKVISGKESVGYVMPDLDAPPRDPAGGTATFKIIMYDGRPSLRTTRDSWRSESGGRWDGKPKQNYED